MESNEALSREFILARINLFKKFSMARLPGICFCAVVVLASSYISEHYGSSKVLGALLLGMAFNSVSKYGEFSAGLEFCATKVLRVGVALLGVRITFNQIVQLGYRPLVCVGVVVISTLAFSILLAWIMKIDRVKGIISGAAVAVCGASAALAVAAILPSNTSTQKHLLCTLVGVTGFSTFAMIVYPGLMTSLGMDPEQIGIFLGSSIHDVAQVLGAGHMVSQQVAELAIYTKMLRVAMLVPLITVLLFVFPGSEKRHSFSIPVPPFLIAFVVLIAIANMKLLSTQVIETMAQLSQYGLWLAMAALGTRINPVEIWEVGKKPLLLLFLNSVFIGALAFVLVL